VLNHSAPEAATYTDEFLVGSGGSTPEEIALNAAINAAYDAMTGKTVEAEVELEEYECDTDGNLVYYGTDGNIVEINEDGSIPDGAEPRHLTVTITYIDVNMAAMDAAIENLNTMLKDPKYANINNDFATSKIQIAADTDDSEDFHSVTIVKDGIYKIEITGANGGHTWSKDNFAVFGGQGGHVVAEKQFSAGDVIKVRVGKEGVGVARLNAEKTGFVRIYAIDDAWYHDTMPGGWPNGGSGGKSYSSSIAGSGGGGATEVYYAGVYGSEKAEDERELAKSDIILVAGGGGGAASSTRLLGGPAPGIRGGNAGPEPEPAICTGGGNDGRKVTSDSSQPYYFSGNLNAPYGYISAGSLSTLFLTVNGSTTYAYGEYAPENYVIYGGNDGKGANGRDGRQGSYWEGTGGGGGGYVGGNAITSASAGATGSGGGGSNYVAADFTDVTNETSTTYGNGAFSIEWVGAGSN
jgi:hypothetical protein